MPSTIADKLELILENQEKIYEAGKSAGGGSEASPYRSFWDAVQEKGKRTDYAQALQGYVFNADTFYPVHKMNLAPTGATRMFGSWSASHAKNKKFSLRERLHYEKEDYLLNTDNVTDASYMFYYGYAFTDIPSFNLSKCTAVNSTRYVCYDCKFATAIGPVTVSEDTVFDNCFAKCPELVDIEFIGTIGQTGLSFASCTKLSQKSIENIIGCLSKNPVGSPTITFSRTAIESVYGSSSNSAWTELIAEKQDAGWNISLG